MTDFDNVKHDAHSLTSGVGNLLVSLGGIAAGFFAATSKTGFKFVDDVMGQIGIKSDLLKQGIVIVVSGIIAGITTGYVSKMKNKLVKLGFAFLSFFFWTIAGVLAFRALMGLFKGA